MTLKIENQEQLRRTVQALAETGDLIAKEERYSEKHQKKDYLASLKSHAAKLTRIIDNYNGQMQAHYEGCGHCN